MLPTINNKTTKNDYSEFSYSVKVQLFVKASPITYRPWHDQQRRPVGNEGICNPSTSDLSNGSGRGRSKSASKFGDANGSSRAVRRHLILGLVFALALSCFMRRIRILFSTAFFGICLAQDLFAKSSELILFFLRCLECVFYKKKNIEA